MCDPNVASYNIAVKKCLYGNNSFFVYIILFLDIYLIKVYMNI